MSEHLTDCQRRRIARDKRVTQMLIDGEDRERIAIIENVRASHISQLAKVAGLGRKSKL